MFTLLSGIDPGWKFKVRSINVHKTNKGDISSQVDKHPGAIDTDRDAIYLDLNYRLIN